MSARIKELETALANAQNGSSTLEDGSVSKGCKPDPVEYDKELEGVSESMGSLAINSEGRAQYYGASAGPEVRSRSPDPVCRLLMPYSS
jgi:hypothetical protein